MTIRLPVLNQVSQNKLRDELFRCLVEVTDSDNGITGGAPIDGNTNQYTNIRTIIFKINTCTSRQREIPILEGSIKLKYAVAEPNSTEETVQDLEDISPNGKITFDKNDIIDTLERIIEEVDNNFGLF